MFLVALNNERMVKSYSATDTHEIVQLNAIALNVYGMSEYVFVYVYSFHYRTTLFLVSNS